MQSICLVTPTHSRDLEQFSLLRRSINAFAPDYPHLAVVNTEDLPEFRDCFGSERNLEIVPSSDLLPKFLEFRRRRSGPKWLTAMRRVPGRLIPGWHAQQLMKLYLLRDLTYEAAAFVDSDVLVCRSLSPDYFYRGTDLKLYRQPAPHAECMDFDIASHEILGNQLDQITQLYDYIYSPACFRKATAVRLFEEFRRRKRSSWQRRFLAQKRPSEYHLLGYAATVLEGGTGYHVVECKPDDVHHSVRYKKDRENLGTVLAEMLAQPKDFALLQSRLKLNLRQIATAFDVVLAARLPTPTAPHASRAGGAEESSREAGGSER
jgi:Family of unknown function (DUF6492)